MKTSESVIKITEALIAAYPDIEHAKKDKAGVHNTYATLSSMIDACKEPLLKNNIIVIQSVSSKLVVTRLQHVSGEFFESELELVVTKNDMQGIGSAITYGRRYSLAGILGISQADDDGALASKPGKASKIVSKTPIVSDKKDSHNF